MVMKIIKAIFFFTISLLLSACAATTDFHIPFLGATADQKTFAVKDGTNNERVYGQYCRSFSTLPFFWRVNMDNAIQEALKKRKGIIALEDVKITHKVQFYLIYSQVCTEVIGLPLYAQHESDG